MIPQALQNLFLEDDALVEVVAQSTLAHRGDEAARRAACIEILHFWEGPCTEIWADEERVHTQAGRVSVTWKALREASRRTHGALQNIVPPGSKTRLEVDFPVQFAKIQAALLWAVGKEFALSYAYSCTRHPQIDEAMLTLAHAMLAHVQVLANPPPIIKQLVDGRPRTEQRFLRCVQARVQAMSLCKRRALCKYLDTDELVVNTNDHRSFWRLWVRTQDALAVSVRIVLDGLVLGTVNRDVYRMVRVTSSRASDKGPVYVYTARQFRMMLVYVCFHFDWASRVASPLEKSMHRWMPRAPAEIMRLLNLPDLENK